MNTYTKLFSIFIVIAFLLSACGGNPTKVSDSLLQRSTTQNLPSQFLEVFYTMTGAQVAKQEQNDFYENDAITREPISMVSYTRNDIYRTQQYYVFDKQDQYLVANMGKDTVTIGVTAQWELKNTGVYFPSLNKTIQLTVLEQQLNPWEKTEGAPSFEVIIRQDCDTIEGRVSNCELKGINVIQNRFSERLFGIPNADIEFGFTSPSLFDTLKINKNSWFNNNSEALVMIGFIQTVTASVKSMLDDNNALDVRHMADELNRLNGIDMYSMVTDPDTYNATRLLLNRQGQFMSFKKDVDGKWNSFLFDPEYDLEWNNFKNIENVFGFAMDDLFDSETGKYQSEVDDSSKEVNAVMKNGWVNTAHQDLSGISMYKLNSNKEWKFVTKMQISSFVGNPYTMVFFSESETPKLNFTPDTGRYEPIPGYCFNKNDKGEEVKCEYSETDKTYWNDYQEQQALYAWIFSGVMPEYIHSPILMHLEDASSYAVTSVSGSKDSVSATKEQVMRMLTVSYYFGNETQYAIDFWSLMGVSGTNQFGGGYVNKSFSGNGFAPAASFARNMYLAKQDKTNPPLEIVNLNTYGLGLFPTDIEKNIFVEQK